MARTVAMLVARTFAMRAVSSPTFPHPSAVTVASMAGVPIAGFVAMWPYRFACLRCYRDFLRRTGASEEETPHAHEDSNLRLGGFLHDHRLLHDARRRRNRRDTGR